MNQERILMRSPSVSAALQRADYQLQKEKLKRLEETGGLADGQKRCFRCEQIKPLNDFYKHPQMADGRLGKCKECTRLDVANRYQSPEGRVKIRAYEKERFQFPSRKAVAKRWLRKYRSKYPEKYRAHQLVNNAIRDGKLVRQPCEVCAQPNAQAHHDDYSKPFEIRWLCFKHHRELAHGQKVG